MKHIYTIDEIFDTLEIAISISNGRKDGIHNSLSAAKSAVEDLLAEQDASNEEIREALRYFHKMNPS